MANSVILGWNYIRCRDGNSPVIFIPRGFEESGNGNFTFLGDRGRWNLFLGVHTKNNGQFLQKELNLIVFILTNNNRSIGQKLERQKKQPHKKLPIIKLSPSKPQKFLPDWKFLYLTNRPTDQAYKCRSINQEAYLS